jgi:hypothetical protein
VVTGLRVIDRGENNYKNSFQIEIKLNPHKVVNTGAVHAKPLANVCSDCGFVMFSISKSEAQSIKSIKDLRDDMHEFSDFEKHPKFRDFLKEDSSYKYLSPEDQMIKFTEWLGEK